MADKIIVVTGLSFGDEGKGTITEYMAQRHSAGCVVRYNGGPQAAHNVVLQNQLHHCFAQFGSATFQHGVKTFLSEQTVVNPISLLSEADTLSEQGVTDALERLIASPSCLVATPFHKHHNRMLELARGNARHGSCGMGVGQTISDARYLGNMALRLGDLNDSEKARHKLDFLWRLKIDQAEQLLAKHTGNQALRQEFDLLAAPGYVEDVFEAYASIASRLNISDQPPTSGTLVFEGAQGMLLDNTYGFHPHVAKSDVSPRAAVRLATKHWPGHEIIRVGVLRAYATRHGAGPFVTEDIILAEAIPDRHNSFGDWQGRFRVGWFDLVAASYAIEASGGIDCLALTNLDRISDFGVVKLCIGYEYSGDQPLDEDFEWRQFGGRKVIERIKADANPSTEKQAALSGILYDCRPIYRTLSIRDPKAYVQRLETALGVPVAIVSSGPTLQDKEEIYSLF
ncbi:adenylosuccinate synthetase [Candidatus Falkowbacteria bacterium]|nr:adenylosuccinate synthetase [Candidatus Falkowbacteria bacterium]